jgi:hypothetical protein
MDVHDGFIIGIYNYCDRWCETCRFTSRCRVFADGAKHEAISSPELKALSETPKHASDLRPPGKWLEELLSETNLEEPVELAEPPMPSNFLRVCELSSAYCDHAWAALESHEQIESQVKDDPVSVIMWFAPLIASKTRRALSGLNEFDGCRDFPPDHEGSAKVALLGIDRSMLAWAAAREAGRVAADDAARFIGELHRLSIELEELVPQARGFIRPAFDEPEEVRKLEAIDWS